jgi:hypothetical protein
MACRRATFAGPFFSLPTWPGGMYMGFFIAVVIAVVVAAVVVYFLL